MLKCSSLNGDTIGFTLMYLQNCKLEKCFWSSKIALTVRGVRADLPTYSIVSLFFQDRVYVQQNGVDNVYNLGLILFRDLVSFLLI